MIGPTLRRFPLGAFDPPARSDGRPRPLEVVESGNSRNIPLCTAEGTQGGSPRRWRRCPVGTVAGEVTDTGLARRPSTDGCHFAVRRRSAGRPARGDEAGRMAVCLLYTSDA